MINIIYAPVFVKKFNKLDKDFQDEVIEKIEMFKNKDNHILLKVHKLHGILKDKYSFSIDYNTRIIFAWNDKKEALFYSIGNHDSYK
jgi:mRNA-degrading endonuclease YafQ of YafQ-DinJ toxin-antitoxin module